jgi:hypothetical protein
LTRVRIAQVWARTGVTREGRRSRAHPRGRNARACRVASVQRRGTRDGIRPGANTRLAHVRLLAFVGLRGERARSPAGSAVAVVRQGIDASRAGSAAAELWKVRRARLNTAHARTRESAVHWLRRTRGAGTIAEHRACRAVAAHAPAAVRARWADGGAIPTMVAIGGGVDFAAIGGIVIAVGHGRVADRIRALAVHAPLDAARHVAGHPAAAAVSDVRIRIDLAPVRGVMIAIGEPRGACGDGTLRGGASLGRAVGAASLPASPAIARVVRGVHAGRVRTLVAQGRDGRVPASLTAAQRHPRAARRPSHRCRAETTSRPARASRCRRVGNASAATIVIARGAAAHRVRADHPAGALHPTLAAVVLVARKCHAPLGGAAAAKGFRARALARAALAGLGRKARISTSAAVGVIRGRIDAGERGTAHQPGHTDGCAWNALAVQASLGARAGSSASAAVVVIARRVDAGRYAAGRTCLLAGRTHAGARLAAAADVAGIAAAPAVPVVAREIDACRTATESAQHLHAGTNALAALAGCSFRARVSARATVVVIGHRIDAARHGARAAKSLVVRARASTALADLARQAALVARAAVLQATREIHALAAAHRACDGVRPLTSVRSAAPVAAGANSHRGVLPSIDAEVVLQGLKLPKVRASAERQQEGHSNPRGPSANYHLPRTAKPPPPLDTAAPTVTGLSPGAVK